MYKHGVFIQENNTAIVSPVQVDSALPVIVGTAPIHHLASDKQVINEPRLIYSFADFVSIFGTPNSEENEADFTLYQMAKLYCNRYGLAPFVAINVFDPTKHIDEDGEADVTKVMAQDIIGGIDKTTNKKTGLALVQEVFPRFRLVPSQILAPKYSSDASVALAIDAACENISGHFRAIGLIEVPDNLIVLEDVGSWINTKNLISPNLLAMYGTCTYGEAKEYGSIHLASVIAKRDSKNDNIPFWSASNHRILCNGIEINSQSLNLTPQEASYLNGQGIVTALNMLGGLVIWGDQTTAYPSNTDIKDCSIPVRRMMNFIANTLVLSSWQFVSSPVRRRMIETVCDTFNIWLNGLTAREYILGGRVVFLSSENPSTDIMGGKLRFHVYVTPPSAATEITFTLEYDPSYLESLFV